MPDASDHQSPANSTRREFLQSLGLGAAALAAPAGYLASWRGTFAAGGRKPNFVLILVDDLGWTDLGCCGSTFYDTPNIDRLASQGIRFTDAYAACPVCSPTRAAIMTGKHPARLGITDWIPGQRPPGRKLVGPPIPDHLPLGEVTIAEALKRVELYNLANDLGERHDLAARMPQKRNELLEKLHAWQRRVGAKMPGPNPDYREP